MNRGFNSLVRSLSRKVAALFAPAVEPGASRGGALVRRTLVVSALGLFAGAAALGMVQQPDRTELPPLRLIN
ncbi:M23 family peptidase, partial [Bordetella hinzii]|nr:M23 family peptidase [Bordetella hinzii]